MNSGGTKASAKVVDEGLIMMRVKEQNKSRKLEETKIQLEEILQKIP